MNASKFLRLGKSDFVKGLYLTVTTQVLTTLLVSLNAGKIPTALELKAGAISGVAAGVGYLIKNAFTNSNGQVLKTEPKEVK